MSNHPNDKTVQVQPAKLKTHIKYPDMYGQKILDTYENLKILLNLYGIEVRYNIMLRTREIKTSRSIEFFDEKENSDLYHIYNIAVLNGMPTKRLDEHLDSICWENAYHPIRECILNKPWDGVQRLDKFISCIKAKDSSFSKVLIHRWMMSAIAAAFSDKGFANQGVLVLQGKQNIGKTRWVKSLSPPGIEAIKEGLILDPSNKDSIITANQCWIGELGELDGTFRRADIARLKSYITSSGDTVRFPFYRRNSFLARRTVFVATVNESKYLVDDTGNRRWWTIEVESIDFDHDLDIQQVWAEVYSCWLKNSITWLSQDEMDILNKTNLEHEQIDPFEERILEIFDFSINWKTQSKIEMTATEVLIKIGYKTPSRSDATRMGKILTKLTGNHPRRTNTSRLYPLPSLKIEFSKNYI